VIAVFLLRGPDPFRRQGVTLLELLVTYATLGITTGAVVGLLRPLSRYMLGAYVVGLAIGIPISIGLAMAAKGPPATRDYTVWLAVPIACVMAKLFVGHELRRTAREGSRTSNGE
jgi:hypothetical protein